MTCWLYVFTHSISILFIEVLFAFYTYTQYHIKDDYTINEIGSIFCSLQDKLRTAELEALLDKHEDTLSCFLYINAGAGTIQTLTSATCLNNGSYK